MRRPTARPARRLTPQRRRRIRRGVLTVLGIGLVAWSMWSGGGSPSQHAPLLATASAAPPQAAAPATDEAASGAPEVVEPAVVAPSPEPAAPAAAPAAVVTPAAAPAVAAAAPALPPALPIAGAPLVGDAVLRGKITLARARRVGNRYEVALAGGGRAVLTLDPDLQQAAERVLVQARAPVGAVVVMATDGRILAAAGRTGGGDKGAADFALPFQVWAPAASIFKLVTASALVAGGVSPSAPVCYHGGLRSIDASNLRDDARRDGACRDLAFGVSESQNAILAKLAHKHLDAAGLTRAARRLGFGRTPDFALSAQVGTVDLPEIPLDFARAAAGFWQSELSPLGGALLGATFATGGMEVTPRVVASIIDGAGAERAVVAVPGKRVLAADVAAQVTHMMEATCTDGTAYPAFHDRRGRPFLGDIRVAGKTGSLTRDKPSYLAYSWFVGFAPADKPKYVVAVLLGNPPKWYLKAHTAARLVLAEAFR